MQTTLHLFTHSLVHGFIPSFLRSLGHSAEVQAKLLTHQALWSWGRKRKSKALPLPNRGLWWDAEVLRL